MLWSMLWSMLCEKSYQKYQTKKNKTGAAFGGAPRRRRFAPPPWVVALGYFWYDFSHNMDHNMFPPWPRLLKSLYDTENPSPHVLKRHFLNGMKNMCRLGNARLSLSFKIFTEVEKENPQEIFPGGSAPPDPPGKGLRPNEKSTKFNEFC